MTLAILKGSFTLGLADFSKRLLLAATVILCARFLNTQTFGDYVFLLTVYQIFAVLGGAGVPNSLVRSVAQRRNFGVFDGWTSIFARSAYIVPALALMYAVMGWMGFATKYAAAIALLASLMVVRGAAENIISIFQGAEDQLTCAKLGVSQSVITLLVTLWVCLSSKSLLLLLAAHVLGGFVSTIYGFILLRSHGSPGHASGSGLVEGTLDLLRGSYWLNVGAFVALAYNRVDVLLLRRMVSAEAVAVYGAPYRVLDFTQIIPSSLMAAILPRLCRNGDSGQGIEHPRTAMRYLFTTALILIAFLTVAAPPVTFLLFGAKYSRSIPVLEILVWATIPMGWNFVLNSQLIANAFDRAIFLAASIALIVNVSLNLLLIPKFGYLACAGVTVVTEITLLIANLCLVSNIRAVAWPENPWRLLISTFSLAGFCIVWTQFGAGYSVFALIMLILAALSLPLFGSDFSTLKWSGRSQSESLTRPTV